MKTKILLIPVLLFPLVLWGATSSTRAPKLSVYSMSVRDTDGGEKPYAIGSVEFLSKKGEVVKSYPDICLKPDLLKEYLVQNNDVVFKLIPCKICMDGACVTESPKKIPILIKKKRKIQ